MKATGKPSSLWVSFAKFYEENEQLDDVSLKLRFPHLGDLLLQPKRKLSFIYCFKCSFSTFPHHQARTIFEKATKVNYKQVDDLAGVWCEYGEMELRHENYEQALRILRVRRKHRHNKYCHTLQRHVHFVFTFLSS